MKDTHLWAKYIILKKTHILKLREKKKNICPRTSWQKTNRKDIAEEMQMQMPAAEKIIYNTLNSFTSLINNKGRKNPLFNI